MAIPEAQLQTWSNQGAVAAAKATHESVRYALDHAPQLAGRDFEVFLQGSYRNDTNIRGDSDVDIVVQLNTAWHRDINALTPPERMLYQQTFPNATYEWPQFRADVLTALRSHYGAGAITEGPNAITVAAGGGRLSADVVVALLFRHYVWFHGASDQLWIDGIAFHHQPDNRLVVNYPKPHYENGVDKNGAARTNGWYKPTVRMVKNARTNLIEHGHLGAGIAPSYFVECLLSNVPDEMYGATFRDTYFNVVKWLAEHDVSGFTCQNGRIALFGPTPEQWSTASASALIDRLAWLWNAWS